MIIAALLDPFITQLYGMAAMLILLGILAALTALMAKLIIRETGSFKWKTMTASEPAKLRGPSAAFGTSVLKELEWLRVEKLAIMLLKEEKFFDIKVTKRGADGGIDLTATRSSQKFVIQCKAWNKDIGVKVIRELQGVIALEKADRGIIIASSLFTAPAKAEAKQLGLMLWDIDIIQALINDYSNRDKIIAEITKGDYRTPSCPQCESKLITRQPKAGGKPFWGCPGYPKCRYKGMAIRQYH